MYIASNVFYLESKKYQEHHFPEQSAEQGCVEICSSLPSITSTREHEVDELQLWRSSKFLVGLGGHLVGKTLLE